MKKKKNKDSKRLAIVVIIVVSIIALIAGGTYSWWMWRSNNNTAVNVTVKGMTMVLDGGGNISSQTMVPTTCGNSTYAINRTITYSLTNPTNIDATATIQLNPTTFPTGLKNSKLMWKLTKTTICTGEEIASGNFGSTVQGTVMNLTTIDVAAKTTTAQTGTMYLSIWLDSSYSSTNTGTTVSDATQNKSMTLELAGTIAQNQS